MILLTATTHSLEIVTSSSSSTDWMTSYVDLASGALTPGSSQGNVASATDTAIVAAPAASTYRQIKSITVANKGASNNTITVLKDVSGTEYSLFTATLGPLETLVYTDGQGFTVYTDAGVIKNYALSSSISSVLMAPHFASANLTATKTITSNSQFAVYVGKAPRSLSSVVVRNRVTTAMATITWGEVAIAKGAINVGGNPTLTVVGYTDVSASFNSTGQKSTTVNVSAGQSISAGDDLWVIIGNSATTACVVRAASIADDIQVGLQASVASRPSTIVGTPTVYTIEGATTLAAWVAMIV